MKQHIIRILCTFILILWLFPAQTIAEVKLSDGRTIINWTNGDYIIMPEGWSFDSRTGEFTNSSDRVYGPDDYNAAIWEMNGVSWDLGLVHADDPNLQRLLRLGDESFPMTALGGIASASAVLCAFAMLRYKRQVTQ